MARVGVLLLVLSAAVYAGQVDRVVTRIDRARRVALAGHRPAWANPETDAGVLPADFPIQHAAIVLARSPERQRAFEELLRAQQAPGSPDYHRWLTPVEVGERFGVSAGDIAAVSGWLAAEGLQVESVSNSHVLVTFAGTAAAVGGAFGVSLHRYTVNGEERFSVASAPSIPAALAPVVRAVSGLYTVKANPMHRGGPASLPVRAGAPSPAGSLFCGTGGCSHYVFPSDFAVIYNLDPVYDAGLTGAGQSIAIIGRSRVDNADIENFQRISGLPVKDPTVIVPPNGADPGPPLTVRGNYTEDQLEATIDVTRAGSVAPGAVILLVISANSGGGLGAAVQYVVDTNPVPARIMNLSFGWCEASVGPAGVAYWDALFSQGAAEGISTFVCSGDSGAAGCDTYFATPPATQSASPNGFCSSTYATCVGGTDFADAGNPAAYWGVTNGPNYESALSYIPEGAWNEPLGSGGLPQTSSTGGGVSADIATPAWQAGAAPGYRGRYTPEVSLYSSCRNGYFGCFTGWGSDCSTQNGSLQIAYFCGTSAAAPDLAGITALINQKEGGPQGNMNPLLYRLAVTAPLAFHDITVASSGVANCDVTVPSMCNNSTPGPNGLTGGLAGFLVGPGYDEATGLGSFDFTNLFANWGTLATPLAATTTTLISNANPAVAGAAVTLTATVASADSTPPMGQVSFADGDAALASATLDASDRASYSTSMLAAGLHSITAVYGGDAAHTGSASAALALAVNPTGCTFSIGSPGTPFAAAGGAGAVNVTAGAGCFWSASATVPWITLAAPASGQGNGSINFTVAANAGDERSTTLTIAGFPYDVEQPGFSSGGLRFVPATPCRIADTRNPSSAFGGPSIGAGLSRSFAVPQSGCGIPATAQAYSLNVTVVPKSRLSYLTLWPTGQPQPFVSTLNSFQGIVVANAAIVPAGTGGAVSVYATDATDVILDINGYFESAGVYAFSAGAYSLNATVVPPGRLSFLSAWPAGQPQPDVSTLNSWTAKVVANAAIVPAGTNQAISVYASDPTDLILDADGYFSPPGSAGALQFYPVTPCRVADTRNPDGPLAGPEMEAASMRSFPVPSSACGIPVSAAAYSVNVTVVPDVRLTYLTAWPTGSTQPGVSTLNSWDGAVVANAAIVPAGAGGAISVYVTDRTHVILDIDGYFAP